MSLRHLLLLAPLLGGCLGKLEPNETGEPGTCDDADRDGFGVGTDLSGCGHAEEDCAPDDPATFPGASEVCDGRDNDCDDATDEDLEVSTWYADGDGDGFGDETVSTSACAAPAGWVAAGADCDDANAAIHPGADEVCDGIDNNCDDVTDNNVIDGHMCFPDADHDGYGPDELGQALCACSEDMVEQGGDCDDDAPSFHPGQSEACNGEDDNCDGDVDEGFSLSNVYLDADGDGFGDDGIVEEACGVAYGWTLKPGDCDDSASDVYPGADEYCDAVDNDCDIDVDEHPIDGDVWFPDSDGDGYGVLLGSGVACDPPAGTSALSTDCNDGNSAVFPGAPEFTDGVDNDCDGLTDEGPGGSDVWYPDADGDGHGAVGDGTEFTDPPGDGWSTVADDCNDADPSSYPGATDVCDGVDNDCDGIADEVGTVAFKDGSDRVTDYTDALYGTEAAPAAITVSTSGQLRFCGGTFYIHVTVDGANLTIQGMGDEPTFLSGADARVLSIEGPSTTAISDVSFTESDDVVGACISVQGPGASLFLDGVSFDNCIARDNGGALYLASATADIRNSVINESAALLGGGIFATASEVVLVDSTFETDIAQNGGAIAGTEVSTFSLEDTTIHAGWADATGGAVYLDNSSLEIHGGEMGGNASYSFGGGVFLESSSLVVKDGFRMVSNIATEGGGAYLDGESSVASTSCDWGVPEIDDNIEGDVTLATGASWNYENGATFSCSSSGCE